MKTWWLAALLLVSAIPAYGAHASRSVHARHAPAFSLPTRSGSVALDSLRGHVVVVDFWASWCVPCRKSFPWLGTMHDRYADRGLEIVAIDLDKDAEAAEAFLARYPAPFTVAFDPAGKTARAFDVKAMPYSFVVGRDGDIVYAHAGFDPRKTGAMEVAIKEACSE